jgi:Uncharacterized protein conserved in bacteria
MTAKNNNESPLERTKKLALEYLKRPHSEKQLRDKLLEKDCDEADIDEVAAMCVDYGFLNDAEYAGMLTRYYASRGYGPGRIRTEFTRRGVPREYWEEALGQLPDGGETIDLLLEARLRGKDPSDRRELKKATDALFRKGYSWDDIKSAVSRYKP